MTDSRWKSISENAVNIVVGFPISYIGNILILPHYDFAADPYWTSFQIGIWFTIISFVRQYLFRRLFNHFGANENLYTLSLRLWRRIKQSTPFYTGDKLKYAS